MLFISFSSLICLSSKKLLLKLVISWPWFGDFLYLASNYFKFAFSLDSLDNVVRSWDCVFLVPLLTPSAVTPSSVIRADRISTVMGTFIAIREI